MYTLAFLSNLITIIIALFVLTAFTFAIFSVIYMNGKTKEPTNVSAKVLQYYKDNENNQNIYKFNAIANDIIFVFESPTEVLVKPIDEEFKATLLEYRKRNSETVSDKVLQIGNLKSTSYFENL